MGELQIFLFFASTAYQISQYRKLKREADKRKGFAISKRGEAIHIPIAYGKTALGLIEANHKVSNNRSYSAVGSEGNGVEFKSKKDIGNNATGKKNEYLIMNGAICQDGISEVVSVEVDDQIYNQDKSHMHVIHAYTDPLTTATAPLGTANSLPDANLFTGCSHATALFKLNREDYNYQGIPNLTFFVKGRKIRDITYSGGVYAFSSTRTYSNNPALVLADYLTSDVGRNLADSSIDLPSFYNAKTICETTVVSNKVYAGSVNGQKRLEDYEEYADFPDVTSGDANEAILYRALDTDNVYYFTSTGTQQNPNGNYTQTTLPTRNIPLYECNLVLDSEAKVRDNIESILSTMPLAVLHWNSEGKYKLSLEYPNTTSDLNTLTQITFNDDNVIRDSVSLNWLAAADRYNQATVTFLNEHENFNEDSVTWPTTNSSAHTTLLGQDNNQPMTTSMSLEGITDPYHALAKAEFLVRQSRTFHSISFLSSKDAIGLEPGDYIKVELSDSDINDHYIVNSIEINEDLTVKVDAYYVDLNAFAWNVADDIIPTSLVPPPDFTVSPPTGLTWTSNSSNLLGFYSGKLDWTESDDNSVIQYIVQASTDGGTTWADLGITTDTSFDVTGLKAGTYIFGVRAMSNNGSLSSRAITSSQTLSFTGVDKVAIIYGSSADQDTNSQTYNSAASGYPYYAILVYQDETAPTLPVTSSDTVLTFKLRESDSNIEISIFKRSSTDITGTAVTGGSYNFSTSTLTTPSGWSSAFPIGIHPVYVLKKTITGQPDETVSNIQWGNPTLLLQNGGDGDPGDTIYTGILYYHVLQTSAPTAPTASNYNTSTGEFGTISNSNWKTTKPTVDGTLTKDSNNNLYKEWKVLFTVTIDGTTSAESVSFGSVTGAAQITEDLASDNYNGSGDGSTLGSAGWYINRDTGFAEFGSAAIRGTLTVGQIPNITSAKVTDLGSLATQNSVAAGTSQVTGLATVATSGSINDISGKGALATLNSVDATNTSQISGLATVATSGNYTNLSNRPTNLSDFTNGPNYQTASQVTNTINNAGFATTSQLNDKNSTGFGTAFPNPPPSGTDPVPVDGDYFYRTDLEQHYYYYNGSWSQASIVADGIATTWLAAGNITANYITTGTLNAANINVTNLNASGAITAGSIDVDALPGLVREASTTYTDTIADTGNIYRTFTLSGTTVGNKVFIAITLSVRYGSVVCYVSPGVAGATDPWGPSVSLYANSNASGTVTLVGSSSISSTSVTVSMSIIPGGNLSTTRDYNTNISIVEFIK